jgi:hypothetical protein
VFPVGALGRRHDGTEDERLNQPYALLAEHAVGVSIRRGVLGLSPHLCSTVKDVERVGRLTERRLQSCAAVSPSPTGMLRARSGAGEAAVMQRDHLGYAWS